MSSVGMPRSSKSFTVEVGIVNSGRVILVVDSPSPGVSVLPAVTSEPAFFAVEPDYNGRAVLCYGEGSVWTV